MYENIKVKYITAKYSLQVLYKTTRLILYVYRYIKITTTN